MNKYFYLILLLIVGYCSFKILTNGLKWILSLIFLIVLYFGLDIYIIPKDFSEIIFKLMVIFSFIFLLKIIYKSLLYVVIIIICLWISPLKNENIKKTFIDYYNQGNSLKKILK